MGVPVVLMAGGRGLRLGRLTDHTPKPLLPIGPKPIVEWIVDSFRKQGFDDFWMCLNYKADLIREYFGDAVSYVQETEAMGTGGALSLLPRFDSPFVVSNADIQTDTDYNDLIAHHEKMGARATMCVWGVDTQVEYGIIDIEGGRVRSIREKPVLKHAINAGIYVLDPDLSYPDGPFHMTDLLSTVDTAVYPITGFWRDCGTLQDYERANAEWNAKS